MKQVKFKGRFGTYKGVCWGQGNKKKILAFHGWLDNSHSFYFLAPILAKQGFEVVAIDFPGHGHSDHRAKGHFKHFIDYLLDVQEVLSLLRWEKPILLGHSMGAAMAQMYSVCFPEKVDKLIMIENLGAVPSYQKGTAAEGLRESLEQWKKHRPKHKHYYQNIEQAVKARQQATPMEKKSLYPLVERGLKKTKKGYRWRTDKRLRLRSLFRISEEIIQDLLSSKSPDILLIIAEPKTYALNYPGVEERLKKLNPKRQVQLQGHHHLHMDQPEKVAEEILKFINDKH